MGPRRARPTAAVELAGAKRAPQPRVPRPQLATLADAAPEEAGWIHEIKFDGYRILASIDGDRVRLWSRNGKDWTARFPAIADALEKLGGTDALLDGEIVALDTGGISSFRRLQEALSAERTSGLIYQVFDILHLDGSDLRNVALLERKAALAELLERKRSDSPLVRFTGHVQGDGRAFYERACALGLEGIVSKRGDAHYRETRTAQWLKVKCTRHEELLVGGYTEPAGARRGFGALLLGAWNRRGVLVYAGKVGTGFTDRQLVELESRLRKLETPECPFVSCRERRGVHWVRPELVAEVEFTEWTRDGRLRHPSFRGLREDKDPKEIRMPETSSPSVTRKAAGPSKATGPAPRRDAAQVAGVRLTHPERVLFPGQGVTKVALAHYYEDVANWILPRLRRRPLSLLRCPEGRDRTCFFQKHPGPAMSADIPRIAIREKQGKAPYLYVERLQDLIALVQAGTLELHAWGCRVEDLEHPDTVVFDLDPGPDVAWTSVLAAARSLQDRLSQFQLTGFFRTTGGKGLHIVVPLEPRASWDGVKAFARAIADAHARDDRGKFTTNPSKAKRRGRIFIDYLRNARGATAIASYSTRAREGAPVAVPVRRDELGAALTSDRYDVDSVRRRLAAMRSDPWEGYEDARRTLTRKMLQAVGADKEARR